MTMAQGATIRVNGQSEPLAETNVAALVRARGIDPGGRGLAIAVNGAVVPRTAWPSTPLHNGDTVEIVQAKQGG